MSRASAAVGFPASVTKQQKEVIFDDIETRNAEPKLNQDLSDLVIKFGSPRQPGDPPIKQADEVMTLHIWDFAGHQLYYTTHQV